MSDIGGMVDALITAGTPPGLAAQIVAQAFAAGVNSATFRGIPVDESAEKRRTADRERKRLSAEIRRKSAEVCGIPNDALVEESIDKKVRGRGTRLSAEFQLPPEGREFCKARGWSDLQIDETFANFRDYWLAKPGAGGVKLDWLRTWQKWVRDTKIKPAGIEATPGASNQISLDDAVAQFAKLGSWSRYSPVTDISQVPVELLAKHGLSPSGHKLAEIDLSERLKRGFGPSTA